MFSRPPPPPPPKMLSWDIYSTHPVPDWTHEEEQKRQELSSLSHSAGPEADKAPEGPQGKRHRQVLLHPQRVEPSWTICTEILTETKEKEVIDHSVIISTCTENLYHNYYYNRKTISPVLISKLLGTQIIIHFQKSGLLKLKLLVLKINIIKYVVWCWVS